MLKIDSNRYNADTKEAIEEFINDVRGTFEKDKTDENVLTMMDAFLTGIDGIVLLADKEKDMTKKAYIHCGLMVAVLMLQEACEKYSNNIPESIDRLCEILKKLMEE